MSFLDMFGVYDFLVRDSLVLLLVCMSIYVMFNAGLFAVPQLGFMAIGSYAAAILSTEHDLPLRLTLPASLLAGAACGLLLGGALARLNGVYLAIATIGFSEMVRVVIRNLDITGGPVGLAGVERSVNDLLLVAVPAVVILGLTLVNRSRHGGALTAMREDQLMATHQGVNVRRYRTVLFVVSGALAGLAGGMQVHLNGFVEPSAFSFDTLVLLLTAVIVGGMTRVAGPLLGVIVIFGLGEALRDFATYRNMVNGAMIMLVVAFAPAGISAPLQSMASKAWSWFVKATGLERKRPAGDRGSGRARTAPRPRRPVSPPVMALGEGTPEGRPLLEVHDLAKRFGGVTAVDGVSLTVNRAEIFGLIGPNGSGKTTFLNLLSGVYVPDGGTGTIHDTPLQPMWGRPEALTNAGVARTFQNIRLVDDCTVEENVRMGAYLKHGASSWWSPASWWRASHDDVVQVLVEEAMERVGVTSIADQEVDVLPYGLKRKVEIARALVRGPELLLLDEPTAGMTPSERDEIFELAQSIRSDGTSVLVVEHDIASMTKHCDRVCVLNFGKRIAIGKASDVVAEEAVIDAYIGRPVRA
jgi:branched-chain amino acid transport system permease protein